MPELLLELFSEEIPARMQQRAADDLKRLVSEGLKGAGLEIGKPMAFATPRRLCLVIAEVPEKSPAVSEERKGPRVGAPDKAVQGFLREAGLAAIEDAEIVSDPKKGDFYVARIDRLGRAAPEIIAEVVTEVCNKFPWPKSMRWGAPPEASRLLTAGGKPLGLAGGGNLLTETPWFAWVRPLRGIVCILDGKVVPFEIAGIQSGNETRGHRFYGKEPFKVTSFEDYGTKLLDAKVLLPASERAAQIADEAEEVAAEAGLELVADEALTYENAGLTEWPTVLMGSFEKEFLDVPEECLITSMKAHQKCFSLRDPNTGKLANKFLLVTNLIAPDGGKEIIAGNEKVIRARLSDAKFFWEQDLKHPLDEMAAKLADVTFHEKLGTQKDRVERIAELAAELAESVDASKEDARRAAQLCKADLVSEMVGEFPELQGLMGRYYAEKAGTKPAIVKAIEEHYKPKGAGDTVPTEPVSIAVALADKLDTLVGFWAIDEKPTGSGDPYQLRRAALGVIRIVLENDLRVGLRRKIERSIELLPSGERPNTVRTDLTNKIVQLKGEEHRSASAAETPIATVKKMLTPDLLAFFADRLKVHLREEGVRHDLIDAVFALEGQDDLALIVKRVETLADFLETDDGENLLAGAKRAANILAIEEKKDYKTYAGATDGKLLAEPQERALEAAIAKVKFDTQAAINVENFSGAMRALAELRAPVDAFFEAVKVNDDDPKVRENRLKLLAEIRAATLTVADFSKIAG